MLTKIILIGMPGSGKSTLGKQLASYLGVDFFDLDTLIEEYAGLTISSIFEKYGEEYFRNVENQILNLFVDRNQQYVLAAGGGTPCFNNNMDIINENATSIFLDVSIKELVKRLSSTQNANRPLLQTDDLVTKIKTTLRLRKVVYNMSNHQLTGDQLDVNDIVKLLEEKSYSKGN